MCRCWVLQAEGGALPEGFATGPGGEIIVEKVVQVPKALDASFLEQMRKDMEEQMKKELASQQAAALNDEQLQKVRRRSVTWRAGQQGGACVPLSCACCASSW